MDKPTYFAILPANVRYDKSLKANVKLMYAELTVLTNSTGICWASNNYLANLYEVSPQAISRWIKELEKKGYIEIDYVYEEGTKRIKKRLIRMVSTNSSMGINNEFNGYQQIVKDNSTSINNTSNNNTMLDYKSVISYLNEKANSEFRSVEGNNKFIRARYNEGYTLEDFKKVIDNKVNSWTGTEYEQYLRPSTLFSNKFDTYLNEKHFETKGVLTNEVTGDPSIFT